MLPLNFPKNSLRKSKYFTFGLFYPHLILLYREGQARVTRAFAELQLDALEAFGVTIVGAICFPPPDGALGDAPGAL